jgi:NADPH:quinone reductase-like Zn-dependent oxidoreductase
LALHFCTLQPKRWIKTMKAMQFQAYGDFKQIALAEIPPPVPGPGQILIEVAASSVNPIDWKLHSGMLRWIRPVRFPSTPCFDFAGEVKALGGQVSGFHLGDRVFGMLPPQAFGAAAECLVVDQAYAAPLPVGLGFQEAAGLPLAGMTALQALRVLGRLGAQHSVLVIGAAGGVGHYAVQIAKAMGARVTGVCGPRNLDLVRSLGADEIIDYTRAAGKPPAASFDLILDTVMNQTFSHWRSSLAGQGVYVSLLPKAEHLLRSFSLPLYSRQRLRIVFVKPNRADLSYLAELAQSGQLRTVIDSAHPLAELPAAFQNSQSGHARGKIIIAVQA